MYFQYIYRHVRRCVHTQGRFETCHDDNAYFDSVHKYYVDIFQLQVSNNTGCNFFTIVHVITIYTKYITKAVFWIERCLFTYLPIIFIQVHHTLNGLNFLCIKYRILEYHVVWLMHSLRPYTEIRQCRIYFEFGTVKLI